MTTSGGDLGARGLVSGPRSRGQQRRSRRPARDSARVAVRVAFGELSLRLRNERPTSSRETPGQRAPGVARFNACIRNGLRERACATGSPESAFPRRSRVRFRGASSASTVRVARGNETASNPCRPTKQRLSLRLLRFSGQNARGYAPWRPSDAAEHCETGGRAAPATARPKSVEYRPGPADPGLL